MKSAATNLKAAMLAGCTLSAILAATSAHAESAQPIILPRAEQAESGSQIETRTAAEAYLLQRLIAAKTVTRNGMRFPVYPAAGLGGASRGGSGCTPYDTQSMKVADGLVKQPGHSKTTTKSSQTAKYAAPNYQAITWWEFTVHSIANNASYTTAQTPAGYSLISSSNFQSTQSALDKYITNLNIPNVVKFNLKKEIETAVNNYAAYADEISTSHATLSWTGTAAGNGILSGKSSWVEAHYKVVLTCVPVEILDKNELQARLKSWIDDTADEYSNWKDKIIYDAASVNFELIDKLRFQKVVGPRDIHRERATPVNRPRQ